MVFRWRTKPSVLQLRTPGYSLLHSQQTLISSKTQVIAKLILRDTKQFPFLVGLKNQRGHESKVRASGGGYSEVVFTVEQLLALTSQAMDFAGILWVSKAMLFTAKARQKKCLFLTRKPSHLGYPKLVPQVAKIVILIFNLEEAVLFVYLLCLLLSFHHYFIIKMYCSLLIIQAFVKKSSIIHEP